MSREQFEAWISAPPFERSVERQGENGLCPGQYRSYETQAAWEAWQEATKIEREACAAILEAEEAANMPFAAANNGRQSDFAFGAVESARRMADAIRVRSTLA